MFLWTEEASWCVNSTQFNKGVWHEIFNKWKKLLAEQTHSTFRKCFLQKLKYPSNYLLPWASSSEVCQERKCLWFSLLADSFHKTQKWGNPPIFPVNSDILLLPSCLFVCHGKHINLNMFVSIQKQFPLYTMSCMLVTSNKPFNLSQGILASCSDSLTDSSISKAARKGSGKAI